MKNKVFYCLVVIIGFILGITLTIHYFDNELLKDLQDTNEFKKELISEYESYYDAAEELINNSSIDSTIYYESKSKIDSLYKTQL